MPVCAKAVQQPDGTLLLALDPTNTNLSTCQYQVEDGSSNAWQQLGAMTQTQAMTIASAVVGLWGLAWIFKTVGRSIESSLSGNEE